MRSQTRTARVDVAYPQVHVQAEGVVALSHVAQVFLDATVVLGVDDRLLAVVGPWVGARRAQRAPCAFASAKQSRPAVALAGERVMPVGSPHPEMISISEEINSPVIALVQDRSLSAAASRSSSNREPVRGVRRRGLKTPPPPRL